MNITEEELIILSQEAYHLGRVDGQNGTFDKWDRMRKSLIDIIEKNKQDKNNER